MPGLTRRRRLLTIAAASVTFALLAAALPASGAAASDAITLSLSPAAPTGLSPITITASGSTSSANELVIVSVWPTAAGCPSSYSDETDGFWINDLEPSARAFSVPSSAEHLEHGSYVACAWLVSSGHPPAVLFHTQKSFSVVNTDSLALSISPSSVLDGGSATLTAHGVADVDNPEVFVTEKPAANGGCGGYPGADRGTPLPDYDPALVNFGRFSTSALEYPGAAHGGRPDGLPPGRYLLCGWLIDANGSSTTPLIPASSTYVTITAPTGTLAYSVPELVTAGKRFAVTANISSTGSDVGLYLDLKRLPSKGRLCASAEALEPRGAKRLIAGARGAKLTTYLRIPRRGVYVACAWLEWPHGTIDGPFPGRVVVAAPGQRPVQYLGITSQRLKRKQLQSNYPISFGEIDGQIVNLSYFARFTCTRRHKPTTHPIYSTTFPAFGLRSKGEFLDSFEQGTDHAAIGGHIAGRGAHGRFSESYTSGDYRCRSGPVTFTARRG